MIDCAKSVVFRVDANRRIGQGHLHRCLTLARHLREKGFRVTLLTYGRSSSLVKKYEEEFSVLWLEDAMLDNRFGEFPMDWERDALSTIQTMKRNGIEFAWMVVDNYNLDAKWERKVREQGHKILVIDDFRNRPHNAEIVVSDSVKDFDQGLLENAQRTCILKGPKFALVDKEFACEGMEASWNSSPRSILISYGSSDDTNETRKALQAIEDIRLDSQNGVFVGRVDVVVGPTNSNQRSIAKLARNIANTKVHVSPPSLAPLLRRADIFLTAGGNSMIEAITMGRPCVVTVTSSNQASIVAEMEELSLIVSVGDYRNATSSMLRDCIHSVVAEYSSFSERLHANAVFDHLGASRIARVMQSFNRATAARQS